MKFETSEENILPMYSHRKKLVSSFSILPEFWFCSLLRSINSSFRERNKTHPLISPSAEQLFIEKDFWREASFEVFIHRTTLLWAVILLLLLYARWLLTLGSFISAPSRPQSRAIDPLTCSRFFSGYRVACIYQNIAPIRF